MYCYTGIPFTRIYTINKDKKSVWKEYIKHQHWVCDFYDLRNAYTRLFVSWDDPDCWSEADVFLDEAY